MEIDFLISIILIQALYDKMSNRNIPNPNEQNRQLLARLWDGLKRKGDGKCYCPCSQGKGFKRRRIKITTTKKHCREHGHAEGGHEYRSFVSCIIYVFILIAFVNVCIILIFLILTYIY